MNICKGISGTDGIVKGEIYYFQKKENDNCYISFDEALCNAKEKIKIIYSKTKNSLDENEAQIFQAYIMLLEDKTFIAPILDAIKTGSDPVDAIITHTDNMRRLFEKHKSEYLRSRADDIKYVGNLLIDSLKGNEYNYDLPEGKKVILAADELSPADTVQFDKNSILGFAIAKGGATSHTVILAKSMGIPAVVGIDELDSNFHNKYGILDASKGLIITEPDKATIIEYDMKIKKQFELNEVIDKFSEIKPKTKDDQRIYLYANIGSEKDVTCEDLNNIDGIGLFRTEFLYSELSEKPSIESQISSYKTVIDKISPDEVTIRTIDIGGDKQLKYMNMPEEENPFLGCRGLRLCFINNEIFKEQIEAILTASQYKKIKILLPMVTTLEELLYAKDLIYEIKAKVNANSNILIGIMIETPASAINAEILAKHCDFFSIGTNDLTQYITASDRGNEAVSNLYTPLNPAVLKLINYVIKAAENNHIDISMCGDMASDFNLTALLLGLGLKKFSVPLPLVNKMKYTISKIDLNSAKELASVILATEKIDKIIELISNYNNAKNI